MVEWLRHVRRTVHDFPELKWIGIAYECFVAKHGIIAILDNLEAPVVALRADMDALPIQEAGSWELVFYGRDIELQPGMGHEIAITPQVAKIVLRACVAMPVGALGLRLYLDPSHEAHTHHAVQLPMPPHVPPPVADFSERQQSADSN